jgi:hypothetical protein
MTDQVRTEFVVMFRTKCGCHRTEVLPVPLAQSIDVPMKVKASASWIGPYAYLTSPTIPGASAKGAVRRFTLEGTDYANGTAEYLEE